MTLDHCSWISRVALLGAALIAAPAPALASWTRTYAVEWEEPALYYPGNGLSSAEPAADCPKGANPDPDWQSVLIKAGYSIDQARWLLDPGNNDIPAQQRINQMAFRGKGRANVYADPTSLDDPGFLEVEGKVGEGINLDGDLRSGFVSPTGERGIDNKFYKALGCWKYLRSPERRASGAANPNTIMREGAWTVLIVVAGQGDDPMNDDSVRVGLYLASDKLVKDAGGNVSRDYTFRIRPHHTYEAIFAGQVAGGRITTSPNPRVVLRDAFYGVGLELLQARIDFQMRPDGGLRGYVGGYRPWAAIHDNFMIVSGTTMERQNSIQLPALWYVLKRNADYSPSGSGGPKTHISYALRIDAVPAYVTDPQGSALIASVDTFRELAPKDEPLISYPRGGRSIINGLYTQPGVVPVPMSSEEMDRFIAARRLKAGRIREGGINSLWGRVRYVFE